MTAEETRLEESSQRTKHWKRWGPYLSERAWGTVREDYSAHGTAWDYFPHDHARSRAYRWNEDGLAGISDRRQVLCFSVALWNGKDPILNLEHGNPTTQWGRLIFHVSDVDGFWAYFKEKGLHPESPRDALMGRTVFPYVRFRWS